LTIKEGRPPIRQAKNLGGWYMREISNLKLQITNKLQKSNSKYLVIEICDLPSKNIKTLTIYA
jgi:hypothetical protein